MREEGTLILSKILTLLGLIKSLGLKTYRETGERAAPAITGALDGETKWVTRHSARHNTQCWPASQDQEDNWSYYTLDQTDEVNRRHYPRLFLDICHHITLFLIAHGLQETRDSLQCPDGTAINVNIILHMTTL